MIKEFPVTWSLERLYCDECGEEMFAKEKTVKENKASYEHECKNGHKLSMPYSCPVLGYVTNED